MRKLFLATTFTLGATVLLGGVALADPGYTLKIDSPPAKKAEKAHVRIQIAPGAGFHVNKEYPASVVWTTVPAGVTVEKQKQTAKDAVKLTEESAEFDVGYTASAAGAQTLVGDLKFAVCDKDSCQPKKEKLNVTVHVQ
jgi:hypothetical protein